MSVEALVRRDRAVAGVGPWPCSSSRGVMNLVWIAVIAGFVLLEKVVPSGR